jgi:Cu/Ag efflux pump CusA
MRVFVALAVVFAVVDAGVVMMEKALESLEFTKIKEADKTQLHEVIFSVKQRNLGEIMMKCYDNLISG